jgi:hypothetical protein
VRRDDHGKRISRLAAGVLSTIFAASTILIACSSIRIPAPELKLPSQIDESGLKSRAVVKSQNDIRVSAAVPSDTEIPAMFGVDLTAMSIQPLWIQITNGGSRKFTFVPTGLDPEYFSPREAAFLFRPELGDHGYRALADHLEAISLNSRVPIVPGSTVNGFVFANREVPTISAAIELIGENWSEQISLLVPVPGTESAERRLEELESLANSQIIENVVDETVLRRTLETLPCCATVPDAQSAYLNLIVIGRVGDVISTFSRSLYRYREMSPMYAFGRGQDFSGVKISRWVEPKPIVARGWLIPVRYRSLPIMVMQVSMPRGGRFEPADAAVDPMDLELDDARDSLVQALMYSQSVSRLGFVRGQAGGNESVSTDGLRAVVILGDEPVSLGSIDFFDWERLR